MLYRDMRRALPGWWQPAHMVAYDARDPDARILEMSHQALLVAPGNLLYGRGAPLQHCLEPNGGSRDACLAAPRERVWYGAYHDASPPARIVSRLSCNPHFDTFVGHVADLLGAATSGITEAGTP